MSLQVIVRVWALIGLIVTITLVMRSRRYGRERTAGWLIAFGLVMLALEEPLLTIFWAFVDPQTDKYGISTLVPEASRAHFMDAGVFGTAFFALLGWIALTALRRGEDWARRALMAGWFVVAATTLVSALAIYSRGVPLPTAGGDAEGDGYGWEQLLVGLLAWACGLWLTRSARPVSEAVRTSR